MCINYRKVNQSLITAYNNSNGKVVSTFPLPKIQELLSCLNKCKYFSSLDLHSGYYHISLTEEAKMKTAFVTADGKYQWNVVPFGLATTVRTFQYLMSTVLTGLNNFTFTYLDDVLVFSEIYDDHLHHLNIVFEKFQKAGFKIKLSKCQFFKSHLHYFGHRISGNGLEPLPEKLKAIRNLAPAGNTDKACHILRLLGYYRSFVPAFANITLPITSLLKKNTPFVWSYKCQQALDYLKEIFCNKLLLQFPDPNKSYVLYTDTSNNMYSGILCQHVGSDQDISLVAYFSGTFTAQNKSWCGTEKKLKYLISRSSTTTDKTASKATKTFNTAVTPSISSNIQDKWVINLSKKELTPEEKALLQKGPKFAVTPATIPIEEYISTITVAALQAGEPNDVDCSGLYHDVNRILNTFTNKPIHTNITKSEHLALENLRKDKDCIIVTADKGVALVVMDKTEYITKCEAPLQDNSVYQHLSRDTSPTIHLLKFCKTTRITISSPKQNTPN